MIFREADRDGISDNTCRRAYFSTAFFMGQIVGNQIPTRPSSSSAILIVRLSFCWESNYRGWPDTSARSATFNRCIFQQLLLLNSRRFLEDLARHFFCSRPLRDNCSVTGGRLSASITLATSRISTEDKTKLFLFPILRCFLQLFYTK